VDTVQITSIPEERKQLSRNQPIALVIGAAGFIGSHVVEKLLDQNIQVIGVDDLSSVSIYNISHVLDNPKMILLETGAQNLILEDGNVLNGVTVPRIDYVIYLIDSGLALKDGLQKTLAIVNEFHQKQGNPAKLLFVSHIQVYEGDLPPNFIPLRRGEIAFAKFCKQHSLNARIVRLASVYGPRMHFREEDPAIELIKASQSRRLEKEEITSVFSTHAIYIEDAVNLIVKSLFLGATANKIYDGALLHPIKVSEVKQVLLDPLWYEQQGFKPTPLPPWLTPNLERSQKELSWKANGNIVATLKQTISYLKEHKQMIPTQKAISPHATGEMPDIPEVVHVAEKRLEEMMEEKAAQLRSFLDSSPHKEQLPVVQQKSPAPKKEEKKQPSPKNEEQPKRKISARRIQNLVGILLILVGLIIPFGLFIYQLFSVPMLYQNTNSALQREDLMSAKQSAETLKTMQQSWGVLEMGISVLERMGIPWKQGEGSVHFLEVYNEALEHQIRGKQLLQEGLAAFLSATPSVAANRFSSASQELSVSRHLFEQQLVNSSGQQVLVKIKEMVGEISPETMEGEEKGAALLGSLVASNKTILILAYDQTRSREGGGGVLAYCLLSIESEVFKEISCNDADSFDSQSSFSIKPPAYLEKLNKEKLLFKDLLFDPDFSIGAPLAAAMVERGTRESPKVVIGVEKNTLATLVEAIGGVTVEGEKLSKEVYEQKLLTPEAQHVTALVSEALILSLREPTNLQALRKVLITGLQEKKITLWSAAAGEETTIKDLSIGGTTPKLTNQEGRGESSFASVYSELSLDSASAPISAQLEAEEEVSSSGGVRGSITSSYTNNANSTALLRSSFYLPADYKMIAILQDDQDVTHQASFFSSNGRNALASTLELAAGKTVKVTVRFERTSRLLFNPDGSLVYTTTIIKQTGHDPIPYIWRLHTEGLTAEVKDPLMVKAESNISATGQLHKDTSFVLTLRKQ
jgi:nucleoside-diphosphate-sugar epimerase